ncbi:hypothetical protein UPYG_G00059310 [Umbra pygmaea]|uniref:DDE Tnp4 domain-containing protein n=1 Tax=Umbra pygmaea TaxID=75934 RepID=A0ABD0XCB7_UMBPY
MVARWPGSTHDARILRESKLQREFEEGRCGGILLGDSGYPLKRWIMTPVLSPKTDQQRKYNNAHAEARCLIERCIGVLKRRFHCLHGEIRMKPERACTIIAATVVLHNICVEKRLPDPMIEPEHVRVENQREPAAQEDIGGRLIRNQIILQM